MEGGQAEAELLIEQVEGGSTGFSLEKMPGLPPEAFLTELAGFLAWWACVSWAATYAMGVAFWRFFPEDVRVEERQRTDRTTKGKKDRDGERGKGKGKAKGKGKGRGSSKGEGGGAVAEAGGAGAGVGAGVGAAEGKG